MRKEIIWCLLVSWKNDVSKNTVITMTIAKLTLFVAFYIPITNILLKSQVKNTP